MAKNHGSGDDVLYVVTRLSKTAVWKLHGKSDPVKDRDMILVSHEEKSKRKGKMEFLGDCVTSGNTKRLPDSEPKEVQAKSNRKGRKRKRDQQNEGAFVDDRGSILRKK